MLSRMTQCNSLFGMASPLKVMMPLLRPMNWPPPVRDSCATATAASLSSCFSHDAIVVVPRVRTPASAFSFLRTMWFSFGMVKLLHLVEMDLDVVEHAHAGDGLLGIPAKTHSSGRELRLLQQIGLTGLLDVLHELLLVDDDGHRIDLDGRDRKST